MPLPAVLAAPALLGGIAAGDRHALGGKEKRLPLHVGDAFAVSVLEMADCRHGRAPVGGVAFWGGRDGTH